MSAELRRALERWLIALIVVEVAVLAIFGVVLFFGGSPEPSDANPEAPPESPEAALHPPPPPAPIPTGGPTGKPDRTAVEGLMTFRGNRTRTYYGEGPVPANPRVVWRFPEEPMCRKSTEGRQARLWCGTGWTGQPAVVERGANTWVVFGAYDGAVHFVDAATGVRFLADLVTGDIVKGSVTVDPDGFPLAYVGSRDGKFRVIALDRGVPTELWSLSARSISPILWNDDWDGSALVVDDYLIEGGENSQWHVVKLNRNHGADGLVSLRPELVFHAPGWDEVLLKSIGDVQVSI